MKFVTANDFDEAVKNGVVLVDFYADWCGPCKMIAPILEQLQDEYDGKLEIVKVDVDAEGSLAQRFSIMSIPTLMLFKDGNALGQVLGFQAKPMLKQFIAKAGI
ncbi:MAG: thioredoxin [Erysipelothrix sp.]|jgi:thioredoxin 1|nr:thioredoxin [Erysipelothrix sp.]